MTKDTAPTVCAAMPSAAHHWPAGRRLPLALLPLTLTLGLVDCTREPQQRAADEVRYTEERAPCSERSPWRRLLWGDLHFHTRLSWDAYGYDLTVSPDEAYAFARGSAANLPPLDASGQPTRQTRLDRPLDFAAATDHAEFLGETRLCTTPGSPGYDSETCQSFRQQGDVAVAAWGSQLVYETGNSRFADLCGSDGARCQEAAETVWQEVQQAAEQAYDRGATCSFVSLIGYEYTASPLVANQHRNILFRNAAVIDRPVSFYEQPAAYGLWRALEQQCLDAGGGCEVLSIPHNTNWSNGNMFAPRPPAGGPSLAEWLRARARLEPLIEIFQHKGDMECISELPSATGAPDPACGFEKLRDPPLEDCGEQTGVGGVRDLGCVSRLDFLRDILLEGLQLERQQGQNPYALGVIGSTDTHNGTPGNTWEQGWPGHVGVSDDTADELLGPGNMTHRGIVNNPGGLAAVWAVENSRDALFAALQRRETYSTSGTRIAVRFFGGWSLPEDACSAAESLPELGYQQGVPMGGVLTAAEAGRAPRFLLQASWDPGTNERPGTPLQQAQIIKGWLDASGTPQLRVMTVAGEAASAATVDLQSCATSGAGSQTLCTVWTDPDFDPQLPAFYYLRVLENPTCRWSTRQCLALEADARPEACQAGGGALQAIQERAITSPIWYTPR